MSTYDASIVKDGLSLNQEQLITVLGSKLPVSYTFANHTGTTLSTATPTSIGSQTISVEADEACVFHAQGTLSCGTLNAKAIVALYVDGVDMDTYAIYKEQVAGDTSGEIVPFHLMCIAKDLSGSKVFSIHSNRYSGSGTIYYARLRTWVERFKRRT